MPSVRVFHGARELSPPEYNLLAPLFRVTPPNRLPPCTAPRFLVSATVQYRAVPGWHVGLWCVVRLTRDATGQWSGGIVATVACARDACRVARTMAEKEANSADR